MIWGRAVLVWCSWSVDRPLFECLHETQEFRLCFTSDDMPHSHLLDSHRPGGGTYARSLLQLGKALVRPLDGDAGWLMTARVTPDPPQPCARSPGWERRTRHPETR